MGKAHNINAGAPRLPEYRTIIPFTVRHQLAQIAKQEARAAKKGAKQ